MVAIFKKELRTYFNTLTGYVFLGFFVLINAYFFSQFNVGNGSPNYGDTLVYTLSMFLILIPVLTMRLFAEESRQKTDQLLYTSPVSVWGIVFGKFLAACVLYLFGIIIISLFPLILSFYGTVDFVETYACIFGYLLLGMSLIAIGIFISVLTDNQIVAAVGTFAAVFFVLMMDGIAESMPMDTKSSVIFVALIVLAIAFVLYNSTKNIFLGIFTFVIGMCGIGGAYFYDNLIFDGIIVKVLGWFSILSRFESFYIGVFSLSNFVYYITFSAVFLYLTVNTIEKRRWR